MQIRSQLPKIDKTQKLFEMENIIHVENTTDGLPNNTITCQII